MLSDKEKEKIKLEEIYRATIIKNIEIKEKKSFFNKTLIFFNSSLGLWLLSAIFISFGFKIYEDYKSKIEEETILIQINSKLDMEIGYRFSRVLVNLFELTDKNPDSVALSKKYTEIDVKKVALGLNSSKNSQGDFLYSEYSNFSLLTLIAEEKRVLEQLKQDNEQFDSIINDITGLEVFYLEKNVKFSDIQTIATVIEEHLILSRWKESGFYFLNGNEDNPFP